jgi:hypothetical protein
MSASAFATLSLGGEPPDEEDQKSPLLDLVEKFPDLFDAEVLRRVEPADHAFFAQVSHGFRAAVLVSSSRARGRDWGCGS